MWLSRAATAAAAVSPAAGASRRRAAAALCRGRCWATTASGNGAAVGGDAGRSDGARALGELPARYDPALVETDARYESWLPSFAPPTNDSAAGPERRFTMMLPPPNVTGALHLGHALTIAVEDTLARWHRMRGTPTLWLPGSDHAGIATQTVVEKELRRAGGVTRHDLGRERFVDKVWAWKRAKGSEILAQMRRLGASLDWSRAVFTLDQGYAEAVTEAFVRLHDRGLVYRAELIINWSPALRSALSDIEVDKVPLDGPTHVHVPGHADDVTFGQIYRIAYPVVGGGEGGGEGGGGEQLPAFVEVATTRPETMLGDVAVAVHPDDARHRALHGASVVNPATGRPIPVVVDPVLVDPSVGTGVVKITPAHDASDHAAGLRHALPAVCVLDDRGCVREGGVGGAYAGMPRFEARAALLRRLGDEGLLRGVDDHPMVLPVCSRTGDVIEPMLSPQWFVRCAGMAERSLAAVRDGDLEILPRQYVATWRDWLENVEDWCVSRQLWWGHQIPAYHARAAAATGGGSGSGDGGGGGDGGSGDGDGDDGVWVVGRTEGEARERAAAALGVDAGLVALERDEDVLDTWFSSALFPFAALGWPDSTRDLERHFPGALLETGHDILFFWVARMVMMSLELTGEVPFRAVYLHAMVRDAQGKKMSKSLGNVIDPTDVIAGATADELAERVVKSNLPQHERLRATRVLRKQFPSGIPACGADALRFSLLSYTAHARDIKFDVDRVVNHRAFLNKVWNAARFALGAAAAGSGSGGIGGDGNVSGGEAPSSSSSSSSSTQPWPAIDGPHSLPPLTTLPARWIASRLAAAVRGSSDALEEFNFARYTAVAYDFWVHDFCDVFIELAKKDLRSGDAAAVAATRALLVACVDVGVRLLAPATPFIADAILEAVPARRGGGLVGGGSPVVGGDDVSRGVDSNDGCYSSVSSSSSNVSSGGSGSGSSSSSGGTGSAAVSFPDPDSWDAARSADVERRMSDALELARAVRALPVRQIDPQARLAAYVRARTPEAGAFLDEVGPVIQHLSRASSLTVLASGEEPPAGAWLVPTTAGGGCGGCDVFAATETPLDPGAIRAELARLASSVASLERARDKVRKRASGKGYGSAPDAVKEKDRRTLEQLERQLAEIGDLVRCYESWLGHE